MALKCKERAIITRYARSIPLAERFENPHRATPNSPSGYVFRKHSLATEWWIREGEIPNESTLLTKAGNTCRYGRVWSWRKGKWPKFGRKTEMARNPVQPHGKPGIFRSSAELKLRHNWSFMFRLNQGTLYKSGLLVAQSFFFLFFFFLWKVRATPHYFSNPAAGDFKVPAITEEQPCERGLTLGGTSACIHCGATAIDTAPGSASGIILIIGPQSSLDSL